MNKMVLIVLCLLMLCSEAPAQIQHGTHSGTMGAAGAASCSTSTNEVGDRSDSYSESGTLSANTMFCVLYRSDCSVNGTFATAYFKHGAGTSETIKACIYNASYGATDHAPVEEDTKVGCSTGDTVSDDGWKTLSGAIGGTATANGYYWLCFISGNGTTIHRTTAGGGASVHHKAYYLGVSYSSIPENLSPGGGSWENYTSRDYAIYITVGP